MSRSNPDNETRSDQSLIADHEWMWLMLSEWNFTLRETADMKYGKAVKTSTLNKSLSITEIYGFIWMCSYARRQWRAEPNDESADVCVWKINNNHRVAGE